MSGRDTAIVVVVVVLGGFLIVLATVYIIKGVRHNNHVKGHSVLPSPEHSAAAGNTSPSPQFTNAGIDKSAPV